MGEIMSDPNPPAEVRFPRGDFDQANDYATPIEIDYFIKSWMGSEFTQPFFTLRRFEQSPGFVFVVWTTNDESRLDGEDARRVGLGVEQPDDPRSFLFPIYPNVDISQQAADLRRRVRQTLNLNKKLPEKIAESFSGRLSSLLKSWI
jgi:hypothetical protein